MGRQPVVDRAPRSASVDALEDTVAGAGVYSARRLGVDRQSADRVVIEVQVTAPRPRDASVGALDDPQVVGHVKVRRGLGVDGDRRYLLKVAPGTETCTDANVSPGLATIRTLEDALKILVHHRMLRISPGEHVEGGRSPRVDGQGTDEAAVRRVETDAEGTPGDTAVRALVHLVRPGAIHRGRTLGVESDAAGDRADDTPMVPPIQALLECADVRGTEVYAGDHVSGGRSLRIDVKAACGGPWQTGVDGLPAPSAVDAPEETVAEAACIEGGRFSPTDRERGDEFVRQAGVGREPAGAPIEALEDAAAADAVSGRESGVERRGALGIDAVAGTPTYTKVNNGSVIYRVPSSLVSLGLMVAADLGR